MFGVRERRLELERLGERDVLREARRTRADSDHDDRAARPPGRRSCDAVRAAASLTPLALLAGRRSRPWLPGTLPMHLAARHVGLVAGLALARLARATRCSGRGWRGGSCRRVGPLAGALDGPPSLFGPCGVRDDDEALPGAVRVALRQQARDVAEPERGVVAGGLGRREEGQRRAAASGPSRARRSRPRPHERLVGELRQRVEDVGQRAVEAAACVGSVARADLERVGEHGRRRGQHGDARAQLAEEARRSCGGRAAGAGTRRSPPRSVGGDSEIVSWMNGRATLASAVKVVSRFTNSVGLLSATGATSEAASPSAGKKRASRVCGSDRLAATGSRSLSSGRARRSPC